MPKYKITDNKTGKSIIVSGEQPPNKETVDNIFVEYYKKNPQQQTQSTDILEPVSQARKTAGESLESFKQGDVLGGLAQAGTAGITGAFSPLSVATNAIRKIPFVGNLAANAVESPFRLLNSAAQGIQNVIDYAGVPKNVQNLGLPSSTAKKVNQFVETATPLVAAPLAMRAGIPALAKASEVIGKRAEAGNIAKAHAEINKAVPPTVKELSREQILGRADKYLAEEQRANPLDKKSPETYMRQTEERIRNAMDNLWQNKIAKQVERHTDALVDGKPIADAIRSEITPNMRRFAPEQVAKLEGYAQTFESEPIPLPTANAEIARLNAVTKTYQKGTPETKVLLEQQHPAIAGYARAVEGLRSAVYNKLGDYGEKNVSELRKDYGALKQLHDAVQRNVVLAEKQTTPILGKYASPAGTGFGVGAAMTEFATHPKTFIAGTIAGIARKAFLRETQKNATIGRAVKRLGKSELRPSNIESPDVEIKGLLPQPAIQTPPPEDVSGIKPPEQPMVHYGAVGQPKRGLLPQGQKPIVLPEGKAVGGNIPEAERLLQNKVITQTGEPAHPINENIFNPLQGKSMTADAVNKGAGITIDEAMNRWKEYREIEKNIMDRVAKKDLEGLDELATEPQKAREEVEGFIAKTRNQPHRAMTPQEIESALKEIKNGQSKKRKKY